VSGPDSASTLTGSCLFLREREKALQLQKERLQKELEEKKKVGSCGGVSWESWESGLGFEAGTIWPAFLCG
jgi:hypothetical protein